MSASLHFLYQFKDIVLSAISWSLFLHWAFAVNSVPGDCRFDRCLIVISTKCNCAGIFFDTYGEFYDDLKEFHEHLPKLLKKGGVYSYFNGLCATNAFFHVVYCQLVALELARLGLTTQFIPLPVKDCLDEATWLGVYHKYWQLDTYFLPVCQYEEEENQDEQEQ